MIKYIFIGILSLIILSVILFTCGVFGKAGDQAIKATHIQDATIVYEDFQEIYNTCNKLNTDLGIIQATPENDKQFDQFSKAQRLNAIKQNLNRWVEDYNAKSKMFGRSLWKSKSLPYQLSVNDFSNYK